MGQSHSSEKRYHQQRRKMATKYAGRPQASSEVFYQLTQAQWNQLQRKHQHETAELATRYNQKINQIHLENANRFSIEHQRNAIKIEELEEDNRDMKRQLQETLQKNQALTNGLHDAVNNIIARDNMYGFVDEYGSEESFTQHRIALYGDSTVAADRKGFSSSLKNLLGENNERLAIRGFGQTGNRSYKLNCSFDGQLEIMDRENFDNLWIFLGGNDFSPLKKEPIPLEESCNNWKDLIEKAIQNETINLEAVIALPYRGDIDSETVDKFNRIMNCFCNQKKISFFDWGKSEGPVVSATDEFHPSPCKMLKIMTEVLIKLGGYDECFEVHPMLHEPQVLKELSASRSRSKHFRRSKKKKIQNK